MPMDRRLWSNDEKKNIFLYSFGFRMRNSTSLLGHDFFLDQKLPRTKLFNKKVFQTLFNAM